MTAHHFSFVERAQFITGSLVIGAMFVAWAAAAYLLGA